MEAIVAIYCGDTVHYVEVESSDGLGETLKSHYNTRADVNKLIPYGEAGRGRNCEVLGRFDGPYSEDAKEFATEIHTVLTEEWGIDEVWVFKEDRWFSFFRDEPEQADYYLPEKLLDIELELTGDGDVALELDLETVSAEFRELLDEEFRRMLDKAGLDRNQYTFGQFALQAQARSAKKFG